jgi:hypothetical protein
LQNRRFDREFSRPGNVARDVVFFCSFLDRNEKEALIPAAWFSQRSRIKATVLRLIFAPSHNSSFATTATMAVAAAYF